MDESRTGNLQAARETTRRTCVTGGSLLKQAGVLAGAMALAAGPILLGAIALEGMAGLWHAAAAGMACLAGALLGLMIARAAIARGTGSRSDPNPPAAGIGAILAALGRMGVPLAMAVAAGIWIAPLRHSGMPYYLLGFYLVGLAVETWLFLPPGQRSAGGTRAGERARGLEI